MWGRPDGGLDTHPAPPRTHTHTLLHSHTLHFRYTHSRPRCLLHTPTRTPYATHLPVDSAPGPPASPTECPARRAHRGCGTGCSAKTPLLTFSRRTGSPQPPRAYSRGVTPCPPPSPTPQHAHLEESSCFASPRATSVSPGRSRVTANSVANANFEPPSPHTRFPF